MQEQSNILFNCLSKTKAGLKGRTKLLKNQLSLEDVNVLKFSDSDTNLVNYTKILNEKIKMEQVMRDDLFKVEKFKNNQPKNGSKENKKIKK